MQQVKSHIAISLLASTLAVTGACRPGDRDEGSGFQPLIESPPSGAPASACVPQRPAIEITRDQSPTPPGVPIPIDVTVTNLNPSGSCAPATFRLAIFNNTGVFTDPPDHIDSAPVASGETAHIPLTVTIPDSADPGDVRELLFVVDDHVLFPSQSFALPFETAAAPGCQVSRSHELEITSLSVVNDPVRTRFDATSADPRNGVWTFKRLMEDMAPTPEDAPAMVEAMLASFTTPETINSFVVPERPGMRNQILERWPRTADGRLDLAAAPLHVIAIANRLDLRNLAAGDAGEGRFVFGFLGADGGPIAATLIFEYKLPATTDQDVLDWAHALHALGGLPFGEDYNAALQAITHRFVGRGARPGHPNGSAINRVRTDEIAFDEDVTFFWELRSFALSAASGLLEPIPADLTPDTSFVNSETLASYINANRDAILAETHVVPATFAGQPFQGGSSFNDFEPAWTAPGVDSDARHHFARNTCNGCHLLETGAGFLQIAAQGAGLEARLSPFLIGSTAFDVETREPRRFDDLGRRKRDLAAIVCPDPAGSAATVLHQGIRSVH